jgi:hypothetical protein
MRRRPLAIHERCRARTGGHDGSPWRGSSARVFEAMRQASHEAMRQASHEAMLGAAR